MGQTLLRVVCFIFLIIPPGFSGLSKEKCLEYSKKFPEKLKVSHISDPSEIGKVSTEPGEFPHMVALGYDGDDGSKWLCGGSLISENFVLTTAHCTSEHQNPVKRVRLGEYNIESKTDDEHVQEIEVAEIIKHPEYKPPSVYNDIALLRLVDPVKLSNKIRPACLNENEGWPNEYQVSATGWGRLSYTGPISPTLKKVYLDPFSLDDCKNAYPSGRKLNKGIDEQTQICAGGHDKPKDTCQGDAGGPLQYLDEKINSYVIIGIASFGKACGVAAVPGVNTRVSNYVPWIESIIWK